MSESDYLVKLKRNITRMPKIITENQALARTKDKEIYDKKSGKEFNQNTNIHNYFTNRR